MKQRILIAGDDESANLGLADLLASWGFEVEHAIDGKDALDKAPAFGPAVVIADLVMPALDGVALLKPLAEVCPNAVVVLLTGHATVEAAVSAMREGAYDYLTKPLDPRRLRVLLDKAVERGEVQREVTLLRRQLRESRGLGALLGSSPAMQEVYRLIELAGAGSAPVLITGETGTGKELVARTIHQVSERGKGPFLTVSCSAAQETLMESELFGHEKGAMTGAHERKAGSLELADGGTVFLDEITEVSLALQVKLLRILQDNVVRRIGGKTEIKVNVRIIAATKRDALQAVRDKVLREDLYDRISVLAIGLPPLRGRVQDIPLLVEAFIAEFNEKYGRKVTAVDEPAMTRLCDHAWPGNVRELRNIIERAVVGCSEELIPSAFLSVGPVPAQRSAQEGDAVLLPLGTTLEQAERELIVRTLESVKNNKTRAAVILGTTPKTLHNKTRRWRLEKEG